MTSTVFAKPNLPTIFLLALACIPLAALPQFRLYFDPNTGYPFGYHVLFSALLVIAFLMALQITVGRNKSKKWARIVALIGVLFFLAAAIAIDEKSSSISKTVGAPALLIVAVLAAYLLLFLAFSLNRFIGVALVAFILVRFFWLDIYHPFRTLPFKFRSGEHYDFRECSWGGISCAFQEWLVDRPNLEAFRRKGVPYPVFIVSAEGGGIYAAGHAFAALEMAATHCPSFRQHIFAISSVSGGSFGSAAFAVDNRFGKGNGSAIGCGVADVTNPEVGFAADHFSPVVSSFVFSNMTGFIFPFLESLLPESSGEALEVSFEEALEHSDISVSINDYWSTDGTEPILLLNTTDVVFGRPAVTSPIKLTERTLDIFSDTPGSFSTVQHNVRLSTGASLSARFPFVTPSASSPRDATITVSGIEGNGGKTELTFPFVVYADAGYFDNSGITTTLGVLNSLATSLGHGVNGGCAVYEEYCNFLMSDPYRFRVYGEEVSSGHSEVIDCMMRNFFEQCAAVIWQQGIVPVQVFFLNVFSQDGDVKKARQTAIDPVRALLSARSSRGEIARKELEFRFLLKCVHNYECNQANPPASQFPVFNLWLDNETLGLPLSWSLGNKQYESIRSEVSARYSCGGDDEIASNATGDRCIVNWLSGILSGDALKSER